jgi:hypothetical protein
MNVKVWNFKLRKTRVIFIISIAWCFISYWLADGGLTYYLDSDFYYDMLKFGAYDWQRMRGDFIIISSPVWMYWIVVPFIKTIVNWIKTGD